MKTKYLWVIPCVVIVVIVLIATFCPMPTGAQVTVVKIPEMQIIKVLEPFVVKDYQIIDRVEYVTINNTIETIRQVETVTRLPEYHLIDPRTKMQFEQLLYDSMAIRLFDFGDNPVPDCDNYARQAISYAGSQGIHFSWNIVDQREYDEIFGAGVSTVPFKHMIVGAIINNEVWYADYVFPLFNEDNTIVRPQEWLIVHDTPLD